MSKCINRSEFSKEKRAKLLKEAEILNYVVMNDRNEPSSTYIDPYLL